MKEYLSTADLAIWMVLIVGQAVLCLSIFKKSLFRRMPWFSLYVAASTAESILLFAVAFLTSYTVYYYVFYATSHLVSVAAFLTLVECGRRVLPSLNLPQKEKAVGFFLLALAIVVVFASLWPMWYLEKRIESAAYLSVAVAFIFIAAYSRYLGLSWSRLVAGISCTLGLLYLVQGAAKAMMGHYPVSLALPVRQLSLIANILAVVAWIVIVLSPWGTRELTEADLRKIEAAFARIEASLGTGEVKTV